MGCCVLADERVLIVGGTDNVDCFDQAWLFDPAAGTWTALTDMPGVRAFPVVALLPDGRVLIVGGKTTVAGATSTACYAFDPRALTWSTVAALPAAHGSFPAGLRMPDGRVLICGGRVSGTAVATAHAYDWRSDEWATMPSMGAARDAHGIAISAGSQVLVVGGYAGSAALDSCELFDPTTNAWTSAASLTTARTFAGVIEVSDGRVLCVGGSPATDWSTPVDDVDVYDPDNDAWTALSPLATPRASVGLVELHDGRVAVIGGRDDGVSFEDCEVWTPATGAMASLPSVDPTLGRSCACLARIPGGDILVVGGLDVNLAMTTEENALRGLPSSPAWSTSLFDFLAVDPGARDVDVQLLGNLDARMEYELAASLEVEEAP